MKNWTLDQTQGWLDANPLPPDFDWKGTRVCPSYRLHKGYGFWLRTTPYHRGLFAEVHEILNLRFMRDMDFPDVVGLVEALRDREASEKAQMSLFGEEPGKDTNSTKGHEGVPE